MSDDITIVSTTDSDADVQAALTGVPAPAPETKAEETPAAKADEKPAATPAADAAVDEKPAVEEKPAAAAAAEETPAQKLERERQSSRDRRKNKIQSEFDQAVARREAARREADAEERRVADLKRQGEEWAAKVKAAATAAAPPDAAAALGPKPKLDEKNADGSAKFPDYEDWVEATTKWHADNARVTSEATAKAEADRVRQELTTADRARIERDSAIRVETKALADHNTRIETFKEKHAPDFDAVLEGARVFVEELVEEHGGDVMNVVDRFTVHDADHGAAIMYHLAQNPADLRRIVALPIPQQIAALARLDQRLEAATQEPARPPQASVTKAPEPIKPVGGTPTASTVSAEDEDYRIYATRRNKEERDRLAAMGR